MVSSGTEPSWVLQTIAVASDVRCLDLCSWGLTVLEGRPCVLYSSSVVGQERESIREEWCKSLASFLPRVG